MGNSIDGLIKTTAGQGSAPGAAVATICGALQQLSQVTQKALKLPERFIDKA